MRGITVRILSKRFSPIHMERELATFFVDQRQLFEALSEEEVKVKCQSIVKSLEDPPTQYTEEAGQFWDAIVTQMPLNWTEMVIQQLKELTLDDVQRAADTWIFNSQSRRSVSVMLFGNSHLPELDRLKESNKNKEESSNDDGFFLFQTGQSCSSVEELVAYKDTLPYL